MNPIIEILISIITIVTLIYSKRKISELKTQNKFLHDQYIKIKNENEELKKKLDPKYQVRNFKSQKKIKKQPQPKPQPEFTYEYNTENEDRYNYVKVKSMKDMYDFHS